MGERASLVSSAAVRVVSAVSPTGIAGAGATIALGVKTAKIKTRNRPRRIAAAAPDEAMVPPIGAAALPLLQALAVPAGASVLGLVLGLSRAVNRVSSLLRPLAMAVGVKMRLRSFLRSLARAVGVVMRVPLLLRSVRKDDGKGRERGE